MDGSSPHAPTSSEGNNPLACAGMHASVCVRPWPPVCADAYLVIQGMLCKARTSSVARAARMYGESAIGNHAVFQESADAGNHADLILLPPVQSNKVLQYQCKINLCLGLGVHEP